MASKRSSYLLRLDPKLLEALRRWADDELRSLNGQVEFLLRRALIESHRLDHASSSDSKDLTDCADSDDSNEESS